MEENLYAVGALDKPVALVLIVELYGADSLHGFVSSSLQAYRVVPLRDQHPDGINAHPQVRLCENGVLSFANERFEVLLVEAVDVLAIRVVLLDVSAQWRRQNAILRFRHPSRRQSYRIGNVLQNLAHDQNVARSYSGGVHVLRNDFRPVPTFPYLVGAGWTDLV